MMIERACPMVSLHVTSFEDATVVGVAWPHVLLDAATHVFMLQAWSLVLAGRESEVPSVMDVRNDVLLEWEKQQCAANNGHEKPIVEGKRVTGHRLARMVAKHLWERSQSPAMETKAICLPRASCERLLEQVRGQIAEAEGGSGKPTTVSEDDILTAWTAHMLGTLEPKPRPMSITSICSVRNVIQTPQPGIHLQTMLSMSSTFLSADESTSPTAAIALAKAKQTAEQTTPSQMLGFTSWLRAHTNSDGSKAPTLLYAEDNNSLCVVGNSLAKLNIFEAVDFAPAVASKGQRQAQQNNPPGTMVFYYNQPVHKPLEWINAFYTLGRDRDGDCWMVGHFLPRTWDRVNESLARLAN
jgi:hypothetical protein